MVCFAFANHSFILPDKSVAIFKLEMGSQENYQYSPTFFFFAILYLKGKFYFRNRFYLPIKKQKILAKVTVFF